MNPISTALWLIIDLVSMGAGPPAVDFDAPAPRAYLDPDTGEVVETDDPLESTVTTETGEVYGILRCVLTLPDGDQSTMVAGHVRIDSGPWATALEQEKCVLEQEIFDSRTAADAA